MRLGQTPVVTGSARLGEESITGRQVSMAAREIGLERVELETSTSEPKLAGACRSGSPARDPIPSGRIQFDLFA